MSLRSRDNERVTAGTELALGVGFVAVAAAVVLARVTPARGYERSIYASTPLEVWLLLGAALVIAVVTCLYSRRGWHRGVGVTLGATAVIAVAALPIIRGYYFMGEADSLTHLGWTREIAAGQTDPATLFYPAYHSLSLAISNTAGIPLERGLMVAVVVLVGAFLVHVPLSARALATDGRTVALAGVAAWFLLPVNNIATHVLPHTNSLVLFYVPLLLFLAWRYGRRAGPGPFLGIDPPVCIALALASAGLVILHLQHAVNVLLLFAGICAVQFVYRHRAPGHPVADHRPLYGQTALLAAMSAAWGATHDTAERAFSVTVAGLLRTDIGAHSTVTQRTGSLLAVGGSLVELFVKLFLVSAIVALLAAGYLLAANRGWIGIDQETHGISSYFVVGFLPLTGLFLVYFLGTSKMAFRELGFIFVPVTLLGAFALARTTKWLDELVPAGRSLVGLVLVGCLTLSLLVVFASPYIYKPTPHVTEQQMEGYETALEHRGGEIPYATLNSEPERFRDALTGPSKSAATNLTGSGDGFLRQVAFNNGFPERAYSADGYYLVLTEADVKTHVEVYNELNYRQDGVDAVSNSRSANLVQANEEFRLFVVGNTTA
jgi:hypothetical protein